LFLRYNIFSITFFSLILLGCLVPGSTLPASNAKNLDKVVHILLFFMFSFSAIIGFIKQSQFPRLHFDAVKYVIGISVFLTVSTEVIQHFFIPRRTFDVFDIVADLVGIAIGFGLFLYVRGDKKCGF